jgi:caa(3)-type oxidase subunit IV
MDTLTHKEPNYIAVFWCLLALTLIEVGVFYAHISRVYFILALILLALMKTFLVAWFFMHLRSERWTLIFMTVIPLLLAMDLLLGLMPDVGRIPF